MADVLDTNNLANKAAGDWKEIYLGPKEFPKFSTCTTILLAIACIIPGISLICISCCCDKEENKKKRLCAGILQLLTAFIAVGFIASFYIAYKLIKDSYDKKVQEAEDAKKGLDEKLTRSEDKVETVTEKV